MGAKSVEGQLERLNHGDGGTAKSRHTKGHPGRLRDDPPDAAQSFDRSYAQTGLRMHKVIRGKGLIRSQIYRRWRGLLAFIKSRQLRAGVDSNEFTNSSHGPLRGRIAGNSEGNGR